MHRNNHYDQLAEAIRHATRHITDDSPVGDVPPETTRKLIATFVENMAEWLSTLNGRFQPERFLDAAGFPRSTANVQAMAARYKAGATLAEVGREFDISAGAVAVKLRAAGVRLRRGGPQPGTPQAPRRPAPDAETVRAMAARYEARNTLTAIGLEFGYHATTVAQHLRDAGVQIRKPGKRS